MKRALNNNRGATSVLIMVMMIILMIFGLAALTTSVASKKLAEKNAGWMKEYYALQGEATIAYARMVDAMSLDEAGLDLNKIENSLLRLLKTNNNFSFQKTNYSEEPIVIEMEVKESGKEDGKAIFMRFSLVLKENHYVLRTDRWLEKQPEIFSEEDELHFSDINME